MDKQLISIENRKQLLKRLKQILIDNEEAFLQALQEDLGKPRMEGYAAELAALLNEIDYTLKHVNKWAREKIEYDFRIGYVAKITKRPVPYGKVLIISPWNYPLHLALMPAINAIAAGNSCVIKPSEYTPATSRLLKKVIDTHFRDKEISVYLGDARVAKELIAKDFDLIFFTGSTDVGKKVYEQASANLTPVIMELGGKNACILDETAFNVEHIREIVWGKFFNAGQTCIAPDTLYVPETIYDDVIEMVKNVMIEFYGEEPDEDSDFCRMVHDVQFQRVQALLSEGTIVYGGKVDRSKRYISPTVLIDVDRSSDVLRREIFGPVLPIVPYSNLESLLSSDFIHKDALTTYLFTKKMEQIDLLRRKVKGMVSINKTIHHAGSSNVPFGGFGRSGFGAYHGKRGFEAFSFEQTDYRAFNYLPLREKYPPYSKKAYKLMKKLRKWLF